MLLHANPTDAVSDETSLRLFRLIRQWCQGFRRTYTQYKMAFEAREEVYARHGEYAHFLKQRHETLENALRGNIADETLVVLPPMNVSGTDELRVLHRMEYLLSLVSPPHSCPHPMMKGNEGSILYATLKLIRRGSGTWSKRSELGVVRRVVKRSRSGTSPCIYLDWETANLDVYSSAEENRSSESV